MWNFLHSWQRLVLLRRTDADVPCSIVDYDWYRSNWVAVTLLRLCWTPQPDWSLLLSESLGQAGGSWWKKTEQPQQPIKEHQLHPFESFMISIVFTKKKKTAQKHFISSRLYFFLKLLLQAEPGLSCCFQERPGQRCHPRHLCASLSRVPRTGACEWVTPLVC